ncbi:MAG: BTAD domain-containing putative transcriptional regulator, partial [Gaiella sp.]
MTRAPGYALAIAPTDVDLERFRVLHGQGLALLEAGDARAAAERLETALGLWRGPSLADLADEVFAGVPARSHEKQRLDALESRLDAHLALGRHAELVGELRGLVREHPFRERARAQLMLALYRSGRQAEALDEYTVARRSFVDELGLEPEPELQRLQQAILAQEPGLELARTPSRAAHRTSSRRRLLVPLVAAAAILAAGAVATVALLRPSAEPEAASLRGGHAAAVDLDTGELVRRIPAGRTPAAIGVGNGVVWLVDADARTILRVDTVSRVVESLATGATPTDLAVAGDALWVANGRPLATSQFVGPVATAVARVDAATRTERAQIELPRAGAAVSNLVENHLAVSDAAVWAVTPDFAVVRIDRVSGTITATTRAVRAAAVAVGPAGVWVLGVDGEVARLDERTARTLSTVRLPAPSVAGIAVGHDAAWVTSPADGSLWRIGGGRIPSLGTIELAPGVTDVAADASRVAIVNPSAGTLTHVDPETATVVRTISFDGIPRAVALDDGTAWVAVVPGPEASAIGAVDGVRTFATDICEPVSAGAGGRADVLITSDLPLQGGVRVTTGQMAQAIAFVLRERGYRAGRFRVAYQSCDDSVARTGLFDEAKCEANARAYAANPDVVGVIGTLNSPCAVAALPVLNRAPAGPLALVSPFNSFVGLTRSGPGVDPRLPAALYPTGRRNYVRVYPTDDLQGAALALVARAQGARRVYVLDDGEPGYGTLLATGFETAARRLGLKIVGRSTWDPRAVGQRQLAEQVARARPDSVFVGGLLDTSATRVVKGLRAPLRRTVSLLGPRLF